LYSCNPLLELRIVRTHKQRPHRNLTVLDTLFFTIDNNMSAEAPSNTIVSIGPRPRPNLLTIPQELRDDILNILIEDSTDKVELCHPPASDKLAIHDPEHCSARVSIYKIEPWMTLKHTNRQLFAEVTAQLSLGNPARAPGLDLSVRSLECLNRLRSKLPPNHTRRVSMVFFDIFLPERWRQDMWLYDLRDFLWQRLSPAAQGWGTRYYAYDVREKRLVEAEETEDGVAGQSMRGYVMPL
jgi:hypothetical protein